MSAGGTGGARPRSLRGLESLRRSEVLRLTVAILAAAGVAVLIESLVRGGHGSARATPKAGQVSVGGGPQTQPGGSASKLGGSAAPRSSLLGLTGAVAAGQPAAGSPGAGAVAVAGGPAVTRSLRRGWLTVAIDQPSTGPFSEQNLSIARGAAVAAAELNAAGGLPGHIRVKLVSQSLDGSSASALQRRTQAQGAALLILPCDTDSQLSLAAEGARYGMLMLAPCNPDPTAGRSFSTYWPVGIGANDEAEGLASYLRSEGASSVYVVGGSGSRYIELLTDYFRTAAKAKGISLTGTSSIAPTTQDFSGVARGIETSKPRPAAIFTALPPPYVDQLARGLQAQGVKMHILGTAAMDTPLTLSSSHGTLEHAIFPSYGFMREVAAAHRFAADYRRLFHTSPVGGFPGLGFETIRLLDAAVRRARSAQPSAVQRALAGGITLHGVGLGDRTYEPGGDHEPVGEVAISELASNALLPLVATMPNGEAPPP